MCVSIIVLATTVDVTNKNQQEMKMRWRRDPIKTAESDDSEHLRALLQVLSDGVIRMTRTVFHQMFVIPSNI